MQKMMTSPERAKTESNRASVVPGLPILPVFPGSIRSPSPPNKDTTP